MESRKAFRCGNCVHRVDLGCPGTVMCNHPDVQAVVDPVSGCCDLFDPGKFAVDRGHPTVHPT